jgi:Secretion system C-terminal sorting domain
MKKIIYAILFFISINAVFAQNYSFNFAATGRRVCLVSSKVAANNSSVKIIFHDSLSNTSEPLFVNKRFLGTTSWSNVASNITPGTGHSIDTNVSAGEVWEYQVKRNNTWSFASTNYSAVGYTLGALLTDNSVYKGQMILLVAQDIPTNLATKYFRLKKELTNEGWFVNELVVPKATSWDSGTQVVTIKTQIQNIYNAAPTTDKPKVLFILGHVPMPRSGSANVVAPDDHSQNAGARGCDGYYADMDGVYTDAATFNPGGLTTPLAINQPNDFKWDQDYFPSNLEMAFGRVDFADITDVTTSELGLIENYLDRLSNYRNVNTGFDMGDKSAFNLGYNNSNDASYRTLLNVSKPENVYQKTDASNHNQWVQNNGPFKVYMQNVLVPSITDWQTYGMNATVYSSDQSYWGFGDVPQPSGVFSRIRALLGVDTKCLVALWTTTSIGLFHQACTGQSIGQALLHTMNHNTTNQHLEKPQQQYDTEAWWNRTHFEIWGDPTISLYQVKPVNNLTLTNVSGNPVLQWTPLSDSAVLGYHIYESNTELGVFQRISTSPITITNFTIPNYNPSHWYMVKAIKVVESGCGKLLQSSIGKSIQADVNLSSAEFQTTKSWMVYPNPVKDQLQILSKNKLEKIRVYNNLNQLVLNIQPKTTDYLIDCSSWQSGLYFIEIIDELQKRDTIKIIKE